MAKFHGIVGFAVQTETKPGVWLDTITERTYFGDVIRDTRRLDEVERVNMDISVGNSFRILADAYANEHIFAIRFLEWSGALWTVTDVEVQRPRLLLRVGGRYNGPRSS